MITTVIPETTEVEPFKEFQAFWGYYQRKIKLNEDFVAYDQNHKLISKIRFLETLATGKYQPIIINPTDSIRYQLKFSPPGAESAIAEYMQLFAKQQMVFYGMEGKPAPKFAFKTIDGNSYTSENTKGKILLFKCWFIACAPCVQEMPRLNSLVENHRSKNDIVFLSLATDDEAPLRSFLKNTKFDYQTVANQDNYITNSLKVSAYPTHFLIDKAGNVVKVSNSADEVEMFLERMLAR